MENISPLPKIYESSRSVGDVLIGTDAASAFIEASSSGDTTGLQDLLSQPDAAKTVLGTQHRIYSENSARRNEDDIRKVSGRPMMNIEWAIREAARNGHAAIVSQLLTYAKQHNIDPPTIVSKNEIALIIQAGDKAVFEAFVTADQRFLHQSIGHGKAPLDYAVKKLNAELVEFILRKGADPRPSREFIDRNSSYRASLLASAANAKDARIAELLLQYGVQPARSGGLHRAAELGALEIMRVILDYGADIDERLPEESIVMPSGDKSLVASWTPLHFAASQKQLHAMRMLEERGARTDIKDKNGSTAQQLL